MDALQCLSLTLLLFHQAMCSRIGAEVTGAVGRSITFHLQNPDGNTVAWSFHHDVIVAVKFGSPPEALFFDDKYKPRLAFPKNGSALTISQLRMGDAGTYTAKTTTGAKATFTLHVYRELVVLTVTCAVQNCSANGCRYALRCTALGSGYGNVSYGWSLGGLWSEGPTILVEESPPDKLLLTCMAQNPISSHNTTVVSPAALCAENTTHPPITGTYSSRQAGIVAAAVTGVGVLLAVVIFLIYCKSKGWKNFHLPAVEARNTDAGAGYSTVYAQVGPYQAVSLHSLSPIFQVHLWSCSKAQQDNSKRTLAAGVETSKTIYSTIQALAQLQTDDEKMSNSMLGCQKQDKKSPYSSVC